MAIFIAVSIVFLFMYIIYINNRIIQTKNKVSEALSDIDVALSRRYATLTNLVEVVKGYAKHEREIFTQIAKLRANPSMQDRELTDNNHIQAQSQLFALAENYPDLKASEQFLALQETIVDLENHLSASRRMYNSNVSIYNNLIMCFPSSIIAKISDAKEIEYFNATADEKQNISIKL